MAMIDVFNSAVSDDVNKYDSFYETWFGKMEFTPELIVLESEDVNCGAVCNELEFARYITGYYNDALVIDKSEGEDLQNLITTFIDLPRRGSVEIDSTYRNRFKFITVQTNISRRTTRSAILAAISYFVAEASGVQLIEQFDNKNLYFQIRFTGNVSTDDAIFLNNTETGFLDQNFISGPGLGEVITYLGELVQRIKAAGVDFDILFVEQNTVIKTGYAVIGTVQKYYQSNAAILNHILFTKTSDAQIV